ncbi:MAG TPA: hypothetical protein VGM88_03355 [Kofleriaceae bacterium]|jgi:hypothetical protein
MSPLAHEIYGALHTAITDGVTELTYAELLDRLRLARRGTGRHAEPLPHRPRAPRFFAALTEVTLACRAIHIPTVAAIVCRSGAHRPADGFYKIAYPRVRSETGRVARWRAERDQLLAKPALLPARIGDAP